ncbi:MAG: hypothetical protein R3326_07165 [Gemmatimonadota bacterium]|nr:hypothetical protein [Gemmatimonadota bacterium]
MSPESLSLVFAHGERAVCHTIDPSLPAGEVPSLLTWYLGGSPGETVRLVWISDEGPRTLAPDRPIGDQVPDDAEIELEPV